MLMMGASLKSNPAFERALKKYKKSIKEADK